MRTPLSLIVVAIFLGIVVPIAMTGFATGFDHEIGALAIRILSLAVVPALATSVAYRQGFERGRASSGSRVA